MRSFVLVLLLFTTGLLNGCATTSKITKAEYYSKLYNQHPKSILVLPAVNTTTAVEATDHFRYTITRPLAERGYYVFPVHLVDGFFKSENLYDAAIIRDIPVSKLREVFNPDAILYVDINAWDTGYKVVDSHVDVGLSFSLIDAETENEIWATNAYAYSYQGLDGSNGLVGLVVSAVAVAANTGTDYTKLANVANAAGMSHLPCGIYDPNYKKDGEEVLTFYDSARLKEDKLFVNKYFIFGENVEEEVALTVRMRQRGYFGFAVNDLGSNVFHHNGYGNYYLTQEIEGKKFLRNRFFKYENNRPFLLVNNKKVFVHTETDGTIPYREERGKYYFTVDRVVDLIVPVPQS